MPNHVACERRKDDEHWRVLSTFAESAESGVFKRMPNQEWRHHTALCNSGLNYRHGHGEEAAFAELFCRMLRTALCESGINFRHGHGEVAAFAELFCGMLRPDVLYAVMKVSPI